MDKIQNQSAKRQAQPDRGNLDTLLAAANTNFPPGIWAGGIIGSTTLKMVAMMIAKHANGKLDGCYPSYRTIARESGITRRLAIASVKWLERIRLFAKKRGTRRASNTYVWRKTIRENGGECHFDGWGFDAPDSPQPKPKPRPTGVAPTPPGLAPTLPRCSTYTPLVKPLHPNESLMAKLNDEENELRTESLDGDGTDWESPSSSPPQSQSLTGNHDAKSGGKPKRDKPVRPVKAVQPVSVQPETPVPQAPPVPPNPPKLWETWDKPIDGITAQDIKRALEFWGKDSKDPYYRENEKLTDAYVSNPKNARRLVDTTPPEYQPKKPASVPDPACPKCHGNGQGKTYHDARGNSICPPCDCLLG